MESLVSNYTYLETLYTDTADWTTSSLLYSRTCLSRDQTCKQIFGTQLSLLIQLLIFSQLLIFLLLIQKGNKLLFSSSIMFFSTNWSLIFYSQKWKKFKAFKLCSNFSHQMGFFKAQSFQCVMISKVSQFREILRKAVEV